MGAHQYTYSGLPGVAAPSLDGPMVGSPSGALAALRSARVCSAAGGDGAITAWIDDKGGYRFEVNRHCARVAGERFTSKAALLRSLKAWWPFMRDASYRPSEAHG